MDKAKFIEDAITLLSEHQSAYGSSTVDSTEVQRAQLSTLDKIIESYKRCDGMADTDDERFELLAHNLTPLLDQQPGINGYSNAQLEKRLFYFGNVQKLAQPWTEGQPLEVESGLHTETAQAADRVSEESTVAEDASTKQGETLYVEAPEEIVEAARQRAANPSTTVSKPGFFARYFYGSTASHDNLDIDGRIGLKGREIRIDIQKKAFALGFSKEECSRIGREISDKFLEDFYMGKTHDAEDYLIYSKTFRESPIGVDYLASVGYALTDVQYHKLEVADRLRADLIKDLPNNTASIERGMASLHFLMDNKGRMFTEPTDMELSSKALEVAMRLGYSEGQAQLIADDVYRLSDNISLTQKGVNSLMGGQSRTLYDFLGQSPTFMADQRGRNFLMLVQANQEVDRLVGKSNDGLNISVARSEQQPVISKAGIGLGSPSAINYSVGGNQEGLSSANYTAQVNQQAETQQRKSGIQGLFSSTIGRVLMMIVFFFIAKQAGLNGLMSGLVAGGGGLFLPQLGNMLGGLFGGSATSAAAAPTLLDQADQRYAAQDLQAQQMAVTNQREIEDGMAEQVHRSPNEQQLFAVLKEQGFQGLRAYLGNDIQQYNSFVTRNNLAELAQNEQSVRNSNGDWLKATQSALSARNHVAQNMGQGVSNSMKLNV